MAEYSDFIVDEEAPMVYIKPKKKKHHVGLVILIVFVVIILLIVGAIAGVVGMAFYYLYDDTQLDTDYDNGGSLNDLFEDLIFDALDIEEEGDQHLFQISITETQLTEIVHTELNQAFDTSNFPLNNYYVDFHGDDMTLVIEVDISFFKTRLILDTTLYTEIDEQDWTNSQLCFGIKNIQIGKIGGLETITFDVLDGLGIDIGYYIDSMADYGISLGFDRENIMLTYKFSDLVNDIFTFVSLGEAQPYLDAYLDVMLQNNLFKIEVKDDNSLTFNVNVDNFIIDDNLTDTYVDINQMRNYLEVLAEAGKLTTTEQTNAVYSMFLVGYDSLSDSEKDLVDQVDFSPLGIKGNVSELNLPYAKDKYIGDINEVLSTIISLSTFYDEDEGIKYEGTIAELSFDDITSYANSTEANGIGYLMLKDNEIRYIAVNNLGLTFDDKTQLVTLFVTLDFNGYIIPVTLDYTLSSTSYEETGDEEEEHTGEIALGLKYEYNTFGNYQMESEALDSLVLTIEEQVSDGQFLIMDKETRELQINLGIDTVIRQFVQDYLFEITVFTIGGTKITIQDFVDSDPDNFYWSFNYTYIVDSEKIGVSYELDLSEYLEYFVNLYVDQLFSN